MPTCHPFFRQNYLAACCLDAHQRIALALGGEAGSRLAKFLGIPISGDSLLRRLMAMPLPSASQAKVIAVDDWAIRRGQTYGTLICDLERKCPIAMLDGRSSESLTEWLKAHPEIEVVSRDRAGEYAKAATAGAPQAIQVADRWHLLRNSTDALQKVVEPRQKEINAAIATVAIDGFEANAKSTEPANSVTIEATEEVGHQHKPRAVSAAKLAKYDTVVELSKQGHSQRAITKITGLSRKTVRRYLASDVCPTRTVVARKKLVSRFAKQISALVESGVSSAAEIYRCLNTQGFNGSYYMVRRYLRTIQIPASSIAEKPIRRPELWSTRRTTWLLSSASEALSERDSARVNAISTACPDIRIAAELTNSFAQMIRGQ